jgi:hypothetical protein
VDPPSADSLHQAGDKQQGGKSGEQALRSHGAPRSWRSKTPRATARRAVKR